MGRRGFDGNLHRACFGPTWRGPSLSLPIIITMGSQTLMMFVDTLLVGGSGRTNSPGSAGGADVLRLRSLSRGDELQQYLRLAVPGRGELAGARGIRCTAFTSPDAQVLMLPLIIDAPAIFRLFGTRRRSWHWRSAISARCRAACAMSVVAAIAAFYQERRPIVPSVRHYGEPV